MRDNNVSGGQQYWHIVKLTSLTLCMHFKLCGFWIVRSGHFQFWRLVKNLDFGLQML